MRVIILAAIIFFSGAKTLAGPQSTELQAKLNVRITAYTLSANNLADALTRVSKQFRLPMGVEWVRDGQALRSLNRTWNGETVEQVLRSILEEYPGYSLRPESGMIHVYRQDLLADSHNFLNLKLPEFFEIREESGGLANMQLRSVVQNIVSPRESSPGAGEAGEYSTGIHEKLLTLAVRGATVREVLDSLAEVSEHNIWVVTFSDSTGLTSTGFRRTGTLSHPDPFADTRQPMWDFLAWGRVPD
jgi:hypothetical protein